MRGLDCPPSADIEWLRALPQIVIIEDDVESRTTGPIVIFMVDNHAAFSFNSRSGLRPEAECCESDCGWLLRWLYCYRGQATVTIMADQADSSVMGCSSYGVFNIRPVGPLRTDGAVLIFSPSKKIYMGPAYFAWVAHPGLTGVDTHARDEAPASGDRIIAWVVLDLHVPSRGLAIHEHDT